MAANGPKILTIKIEPSDSETKVVFSLGLKSLEKNIPLGFGLVRASAILDDKGQLSDVEIVMDKL